MQNLNKIYVSKAFLILMLVIGFTGFVLAENPAEELQEKVRSAIASEYMEEFEITADNNGNVEIEGEVSSLYDKYRVFDLASRVPGVQTITNQIIVDTPLLPDDIVADAVREELDYVSAIKEPNRIEVNVDNGVVFLAGKVSFYREKVMARTVASWQKGVKGVVNNIEMLPPEEAYSDANLEKVLRSVLQDRFTLAEKNVTLMVENGVATIYGTVNSFWTKNNIEEEFRNVLGIRKVINQLKVKNYES